MAAKRNAAAPILKSGGCAHEVTASLYRRAPRSGGGGFVPDARRCLGCRALLERKEGQ